MAPRFRLLNHQSLNPKLRCRVAPSRFAPKISSRSITADEKPLPTTEQPKGPNQDQLPHVSEEAAEIGKTTGQGGPETEQGTSVQEAWSHLRLLV